MQFCKSPGRVARQTDEMLAIALLLSAQVGPPPNQRFRLDSDVDALRGIVYVSMTRMATNPDGSINEGAPPYRWEVPPGAVRVSIVGESGQRATPKVVGFEKGLEDRLIFTVGGCDGFNGNATLDWRGCAPGFYRIVTDLSIRAEDRSWTEKNHERVFYWNPSAKLPSDQPDQKFLLARRKPRTLGDAFAAEAEPIFATTLTLENSPNEPSKPRRTWLKSDKNGKPYEAQFNPENLSEDLLHVFADDEIHDLRKRYLGKTLYPMGGYLSLVTRDSVGSLAPIDWNGRSVVIREFWRASRPTNLFHLNGSLAGGKDYLISQWLPIYVIFDTVPTDPLFRGKDLLEEQGPFIALVPDTLFFERGFSTTSKATDFQGWPDPDPTHATTGMTRKQIAWVNGWPAFVGSMSETLAKDKWTYEPEDGPTETIHFVNGKMR